MPDCHIIGVDRANAAIARAALGTGGVIYFSDDTRFLAAYGHYLHKPQSRFSHKEANLPLDLWDLTPDP